jgi:hypothetical protein
MSFCGEACHGRESGASRDMSKIDMPRSGKRLAKGLPLRGGKACHGSGEQQHTSDFFRGRDSVDLTPPGSFLNKERRTRSRARTHTSNHLCSKYRAFPQGLAIENNQEFIRREASARHSNRRLPSPLHEYRLDLLANLLLLALLQLLPTRIKLN